MDKDEMLKKADDLDARRRLQIAAQAETITRLLDDPSAVAEIQKLHELLAQTTHERDEAISRLETSEGAPAQPYDLGGS